MGKAVSPHSGWGLLGFIGYRWTPSFPWNLFLEWQLSACDSTRARLRFKLRLLLQPENSQPPQSSPFIALGPPPQPCSPLEANPQLGAAS